MHSARYRKSRGQGLVELAVILPIFLLLFMGLFDLGRVVYALHTITEDSKEASRTGQVSAVYSTTGNYGWIRDAARRMSAGVTLTDDEITGDPTQGCAHAAADAGVTGIPDDTASPSTCFYPDGVGAGGRVVVNISLSVPLITPILSQIVGGQITVSGQSTSAIQ